MNNGEIDPNAPGDIGPGEVTDAQGYQEAVARGDIAELQPGEAVASIGHGQVMAELEARAAAAEEIARQAQLREQMHRAQLEHQARELAELRKLAEAHRAAVQAIPLNAVAAAPFAPTSRQAQRMAAFAADLDRQQDRHEGTLKLALGTLGMPRTWGRVLKASAPAIGVAARGLILALHPESPGGSKPTRDELEEVFDRAARRWKKELVEEFLGDLR